MIISFEGLDGCGKTTQIGKLTSQLSLSGKKFTILREPGGSSLCENLRTILLDKKNLQMCSETELLLYLASRAQLVAEVIAPAVNSGDIVIMDRYVDSTLAYQGYGRKLDIETVKSLNHFVTCSGKYMPDITFFLDLEAVSSLGRVHNRGEEINRMESLDLSFFRDVRKGFLEISRNEPERLFVLDGSAEADIIFAQIKEVLKSRKIL
jgi:dTMP kinase